MPKPVTREKEETIEEEDDGGPSFSDVILKSLNDPDQLNRRGESLQSNDEDKDDDYEEIESDNSKLRKTIPSSDEDSLLLSDH